MGREPLRGRFRAGLHIFDDSDDCMERPSHRGHDQFRHWRQSDSHAERRGMGHARFARLAANAMTVDAGDLVIGGGFTMVNGQPANRVARWNGSAWSAFGSGLSGTVNALAVHAGQLVAAGARDPQYISDWKTELAPRPPPTQPLT